MPDVLRIENLSKSFGRTKVLAGVSLSLQPGERLAVLGSSGSGKTTLLRLIAGLDVPDRGEIDLAGERVTAGAKLLLPPERRNVAMVFQGLALFPHLRAIEQIAYGARGDRQLAVELLNRVGLGHRASARMDELSGGERQRIALARALAQKPRVLLMDEPFASLDDEKRGDMRDLLRDLLDPRETALVLVTHSRDDALHLAERALVLDHGVPVVQDLLSEVLISPRHVAAARVLGLGQILRATIDANGSAQTAFGLVAVLDNQCTPGPSLLLVRADQPRIVDQSIGVSATVTSIELQSTGRRAVQQIAVVRVGEQSLRVLVREGSVRVGQSVHVVIDGPCEPLAGGDDLHSDRGAT